MIINKEKTLEVYNTNVVELKPNSEKLVICNCEECVAELIRKFRVAKKNKRCLDCSNKKNANTNIEQRSKSMIEYCKENEHPLKDTKRPQHVIEALRKAASERIWTDEQRKKVSEQTKGENNPFYGKKHSEKSLKQMRKSQAKIARRGIKSNFYGKTPFHGKGEWYIKKDSSKVWMRSSWERKFAKYLDEQNILWEYELHTFPLNCFDYDKTYTPDFYLTEEKKYVEIKGWWRDDAKEKFECFKEQYKELIIELLQKEELKNLKVL